MNLRMIPLSEIPYSGRETEAQARRDFTAKNADSDRAAMARAAEYEIEDAPGTYSNLPRSYGWVLTQEAEAITNHRCSMPGGTSHRLFTCEVLRNLAV